MEEGIPVLQPEKPRGEEFLAQLRDLDPEISVVAAYGEILTEEVLGLPSRGSVNVHASLLPELRGAAPVNWAIIRGHEHTGVTIMRMVRELDAGPVLYRVAVELPPDLTAGELYEMLSEIGATALVEALAQMEAGV
ncbi:MAG: methionyl-tRNA formyltransferase, partial [Gemmatimonadota bacterium]